jgi:hypothetical protein
MRQELAEADERCARDYQETAREGDICESSDDPEEGRIQIRIIASRVEPNEEVWAIVSGLMERRADLTWGYVADKFG